MKLNKEQRKTLQELLELGGLSELERLRIIQRLYEIELSEHEQKQEEPPVEEEKIPHPDFFRGMAYPEQELPEYYFNVNDLHHLREFLIPRHEFSWLLKLLALEIKKEGFDKPILELREQRSGERDIVIILPVKQETPFAINRLYSKIKTLDVPEHIKSLVVLHMGKLTKG